MGWNRKDLLSMQDLEAGEITEVLDTAQSMKEIASREIKKVPTLRGKTVVNLFYEASTRTRASFEHDRRRDATLQLADHLRVVWLVPAMDGLFNGSASERRRQNVSHPNSVKVSVSDTGPGIPAEFHLEVFDDFFRLPQNEEQTEGMGLGLAIANHILAEHNAHIRVEDNQPAGARFTIEIPAVVDVGEEPRPAESAASATHV